MTFYKGYRATFESLQSDNRAPIGFVQSCNRFSIEARLTRLKPIGGQGFGIFRENPPVHTIKPQSCINQKKVCLNWRLIVKKTYNLKFKKNETSSLRYIQSDIQSSTNPITILIEINVTILYQSIQSSNNPASIGSKKKQKKTQLMFRPIRH